MKTKTTQTVLLIFIAMVAFLPIKSAVAQEQFIEEHAPFGVLECAEDHFKIRTAYLLCFDAERRIPKWTMYHVKKDYRSTPERSGRFSSFRDDPDIENEAQDREYTGLFSSRGYARGHFTPFGVLGGDRDGDGEYASLNETGDEDEEKAVYEGNYMSNIAPQHHKGFNSSPGLWWKLERWLQDEMVTEEDEEAHVVAGAIFGSGEVEKVGPNSDIFVPPMFYKVVSFEPTSYKPRRNLAFLFPHQRKAHGEIQDFLTSIDVIEAMTGLDFYKDLEVDEDQDTWEVWKDWFLE